MPLYCFEFFTDTHSSSPGQNTLKDDAIETTEASSMLNNVIRELEKILASPANRDGFDCRHSLPGAIETKPGSATVPFFGIEPDILDPMSGKVRSPLWPVSSNAY